MSKSPERWYLHRQGHEHVLEILDAGLGRSLTWTVDGAEVASRKTSDDRVVLTAPRQDGSVAVGALGVRLPSFVGPARRVTLYDDERSAHARLGGTDLEPEPGSRAAAREAWIRAHPHRYTAKRTVAAAAGVLVPLLLAWLLAHVALPAVPWPDLPRIPWPDLPSVPWPGLPSVPWPDLPSVSLPDVPQWVEDAAQLVGPVLLAFALARGEVRRRRRNDERRSGSQGGTER